MGKQYIGNIYDTAILDSNITEPLVDYNYMLGLPMFKSPQYGSLAQKVGDRCVSINLPFRNYNAEEIQSANEKRYYTTTSDIGDVDAEFLEDITLNTLIYFLAWQSKIRILGNGNYYHALPSNYKRNVEVLVIDSAGYLNAKFKLVGAFPINIEPIQLGSEGQIVKVRVNFKIDDIEVEGVSDNLIDLDFLKNFKL